MSRPRILLASASPRRAELLRALGLEPECRATGIPETLLPGEPPDAHVARLAQAKLDAALASSSGFPGIVLAADTAVVVEGSILGKPLDEADAARMLRLLSGRRHEVLTALAAARAGDDRRARALASTAVRFRTLTDDDVRWYVATGEPMDKAGAYGIQGLGAVLTDGIEGSWSNVVGLPLERLPEVLERVGIPWRSVLG